MNNFMPLDTIKETSSGDYDKADVERYIAELMSDFSRVKSVMQRNVDAAKAEKERIDQEREQLLNDRAALSSDREAYLNKSEALEAQVREFEEKLAEMSRLQEDLGRVEDERMALAARLGEIEGQNIQSTEDLQSILEEKQEIEGQNQMLQDAYEEALERIRLLTQEKEDAVLSELEAMERLSTQSRMYDDLAAEFDNLQSINEKLEADLDRGYDAGQFNAGQNTDFFQTEGFVDFNIDESEFAPSDETLNAEFENRYGTELVTDSGMELFKLLRGIVEGGEEDNGVKLTKTWEEESEEEIPSDNPDGPSVIKRTRKKSEISVEYISGKK